MISLLPILLKQSTTVILVNISSPNSKFSSSHTMSTFGYLCISSAFFSLDQFSSIHQEVLFCFADGYSMAWYSFFLVTVDVSCYAELSAPDFKEINSKPNNQLYLDFHPNFLPLLLTPDLILMWLNDFFLPPPSSRNTLEYGML